MLVKLCISAISIIVAIPLYRIITEEKCHNIPALDHVYNEKLTGIWYIYQISTPRKNDRKCYMINVTVNKSSVVVKEIWLQNNTKHEGYVYILPGKYSSHFEAQWLNFQPKPLLLVNLDYDDFLVTYLCWPQHTDGGVVFVWTRKRQPDRVTINRAHESIIGVGLSPMQPFLYTLDHDGCDTELYIELLQ